MTRQHEYMKIAFAPDKEQRLFDKSIKDINIYTIKQTKMQYFTETFYSFLLFF